MKISFALLGVLIVTLMLLTNFAFSLQTGYAYLSNFGSTNIVIINPSNQIVGAISSSVGSGPTGIAFFPNGKYAYVVSEGVGNLDIINAVTNSVITATSTTGFSTPFGIAISPNGAYAYVTNFGSSNVAIVSTVTNSVTGFITSPKFNQVQGVAFAPNGAYAYVTNRGDSNVLIINTSTSTVVNTITSVGKASGIVFTPDGKLAYVSVYGNSNIIIINTATNSIVNSINGDQSNDYGISISNDGSYGFSSNFNANNVIIYSTATNSVVGVITGFNEPTYSAFAPTITNVGTVSLSSNPELPNTLDTGANIIFTSSWSGTASPFSANYVITNTISGAVVASNQYNGIYATSNSFTWTIPGGTAGDTFKANVIVIDANANEANSVYSNTLTVASTPPISGVTLTSTPALPISIDIGQQIIFSSTWNNGITTYSANYIFTNTITDSVIGYHIDSNLNSKTDSWTWTPTPSYSGNTIKVNVIVTDGDNNFAASSYLQTLTINTIIEPCSVPNVVVCIPIWINNTQSTNTPAPFQQKVVVNRAAFGPLINYNGISANFEFTYPGNAVIPAYIETGISTTWEQYPNIIKGGMIIAWLNLSDGLPADSNTLVYLAVMPRNTNMLDASGTNGIGEAPTLSPSYAEYDDGAHVFDFYDNFNGVSLGSKWLSSNALGYSIDNGITIDGGAVYTSSGVFDSLSGTAEAEMTETAQSQPGYGGFGVSDTNSPQAGNGGSNAEMFILTNNGRAWGFDAADGTTTGYNIASNLEFYGDPIANQYSVIGEYVSPTNIVATNGAQKINMLAGTYNKQQNLILGSFQGAGGGPQSSFNINFKWVRIRSTPPNGIMPLTSIGNAKLNYWPTSNKIDIGEDQQLNFNATFTAINASSVTYNMIVYNSIGAQVYNSLYTFNDINQTNPINFSVYFTQNSLWGTGTFTSNILITDQTGYTAVNSTSYTVYNSFTVENVIASGAELEANVIGGDAPYTYQWYSSNSPSCNPSSPIIGQTANIFTLPPTTRTYYCYSASDSSSNSINGTQTLNLSVLGDSISYGFKTPDPATDSYQALLSEGDARITDNNQAIPGRTLNGTLDPNNGIGMATLVHDLTDTHPNVIYLAIGLNDWSAVSCGGCNGGTGGVGTENGILLGDEYNWLLENLSVAAPHAHIFGQGGITTVNELSVNSYGYTMDDFSNIIMSVCAAQSYCTPVNGSDIVLNPTDQVDGVHPTLNGQIKYMLYVRPLVYTDFTTSQNLLFSSPTSYTVNAFYVSADPILPGKTETATMNVVGGIGPYTYNLLIYNSGNMLVDNSLYTGVAGTSNTFSFTQNSNWGSGTFTANIYVTDHTSMQVSNIITYVVTQVTTTIPQPITGGGVPSTIASTSVATTTVPVTTTIHPTIIINSTYNVSNLPSVVMIGDAGSVSVTSQAPVSIILKVINVTRSTTPITANKIIAAFNVIAMTPANVPVNQSVALLMTLRYNCSIPAALIAPYLFANLSWIPVRPFIINSSACTVIFHIPSDPVVALFERQPEFQSSTSSLPTTTTPAGASPTTTTSSKPLSAKKGSVALAAIVVIVVIVIFVLLLFSKRKRLSNRRSRTPLR